MRMHRFLRMAADAERLMISHPVVMFLRVDMVSVQVLVMGGVAKINPTFFVLACPAMFCSVARTGFAKTTIIVVERRCIVGM